MDDITRPGFRPAEEGHRHRDHAMPAALLAVVAILAGCGAGSSSTLSSTQIAANDVNAGLAQQMNGNLTAAASDYADAIAHDPKNKYAYYDLGDVDQLKGLPAAAEQNYRSALLIDPNFVSALYNLAILRTVPSPAQAEDLYRQVIALQPKDAIAHLNLGFLLRSERRTAEGNAELNVAVRLDPSLASRIPAGILATPAPVTPSPSPSH